MRLRPAGVGLVGGLLTTAGLAPFGWWPLAIAGLAVVAEAARDSSRRRRVLVGLGFGLGLCLPGLWWMTEFTLPGFVLAALLETALVGVAVVATPAGRWRALGLPAALVLSDALRHIVPFGGVPIATIAETQAGSPLLEVSRIGGPLLLTWLTATAAVGLASVLRRRALVAVISGAAVLAVLGLAQVAPDGERVGEIEVAVVQGGGKRGTRAVDSSAAAVFDAHLAASERVREGVDLVLWPEDVVDVDADVRETPEGDELAAAAMSFDAPLVAGVVTKQKDSFTNVAQVWEADGSFGPTYEKNQRVPFGEYIPFRSLVEQVADVSAVPRDASIGQGAGLLRTSAGRLGVVISFEVFFARRSRAAIDAGGQVLLVPTNAASYSTTQMPALELAAARMRAVETGRAVLQAAPTGFSAVVAADGSVRRHTDLGRRQVLHERVALRTGHTLYTRVGDTPLVLGALLGLALAWLLQRFAPGRPAHWLRPARRHP